MFLDEMAKVFEDLGCKAAYNLDGGHCSFMTMKDQVANHPYKPEHEVEDKMCIRDRKTWDVNELNELLIPVIPLKPLTEDEVQNLNKNCLLYTSS